MERNRMVAKWALAAVLCGLMTTGIAKAQATPDSSSDPSARQGGAPDRLEHMSQQLNLTPEQKEKLRPMLEQEQKQMIELRHDPNLTEEQKRAKEREIHQSFRPQLENVLTPQQRTQFREQRRDVVAKRKSRKGQPPPTTAPPQ